jgi:peptidoglycan/LPS O-acetylase OafA/YrhL
MAGAQPVLRVDARLTATKAFRLDINALRALSVLAVLGYHFRMPGFAGGFVGVDVFLVITGYLMTGKVINDLILGRFSFHDFSIMRMRRIYPALVVVVVSSAVAGWFVTLPGEYLRHLRQACYALLFLSNFAFDNDNGYFAMAAQTKPLLHTWSLSVEWQFYIWMPLVVSLVWRLAFGSKSKLSTVIFALQVVAVSSLAWCLWESQHDAMGSAFFSLRARAWEPLAGGLIAAEEIRRRVDGVKKTSWLLLPNSAISHSIVATGQVLSPKAPAALPPRPTRAEYCAAFLVNDDQQGSNLRLAAAPNNPIGEVPHNVQDNTIVLIIPLPSKVYLPAETAETLAWAFLDLYVADWPSHKSNNAGGLGSSEKSGDEVVSAHASNTIVARTYLTYGWKYKHRAIRNNLSANVKKIVRDLDVPKYVYVTEYSLTRQLDDRDLTERRIIAHVVVDATAKHHDFEGVLFFHAPGICLWNHHGPNNDLVRYGVATADDDEYFPKARGDVEFAASYAAMKP